ncbi:hypothetical protein [Pseudarthrobacter sulfonivorans]|nr:hypothetical protein [Pseudarthrobacter sulfonivorans]MDP9999069.1 hypothetical protein [Pseudarthrobacter sulfonivorans]
MTSDDEKDPPVPADLEGSVKRIRRAQGVEDNDHEPPADEPND